MSDWIHEHVSTPDGVTELLNSLSPTQQTAAKITMDELYFCVFYPQEEGHATD